MKYKISSMIKGLANFDSVPYSSFLLISLFFFKLWKESQSFLPSLCPSNIYQSVSGVLIVVQLMFYLVCIANFRETKSKDGICRGP